MRVFKEKTADATSPHPTVGQKAERDALNINTEADLAVRTSS